LKKDKQRFGGHPDDQQECRRSHCEHYERPEMMVYGLSLQWTLFFHIEGYAMPETAVNVASHNNIQQLSRTSMTLESVLREAQS
jgi:hypothetical protein